MVSTLQRYSTSVISVPDATLGSDGSALRCLRLRGLSLFEDSSLILCELINVSINTVLTEHLVIVVLYRLNVHSELLEFIERIPVIPF